MSVLPASQPMKLGPVPPPEGKELKIGFEENIDPSLARLQTMDYSCPICFLLMEQPVKTPCGHIFCITCMKDMSKREGFACPTCRRDLKSFTPPGMKVDQELSSKFIDLNAKRVAAGLATPESMLSILDDLPFLPQPEALAILADHQRRNGLRPLRRLTIRKIKSTMVSQFKLQSFAEKRITQWRDGSVASAARQAVSPRPIDIWGLAIVPPTFFKEGRLHISIAGTEESLEAKSDSGHTKRHIAVEADFNLIETESVVVADNSIEFDSEKIEEIEGTGDDDQWIWHTLPPGDPKKEAIKGVQKDSELRTAIQKSIDENDTQAKHEMRRILARRQAVRFYRFAEVICQFGNGRAPFTYWVLQSFAPSNDTSNINENGPGKTLRSMVWYKEYPVEPACCSVM
mmetsp:Transcript_2644/g.6077  ORF Transcript_2644/g.6077 Transcript_2644/m.6077 type:complete len:401 (-) Transcript_2644:180-1382(-)